MIWNNNNSNNKYYYHINFQRWLLIISRQLANSALQIPSWVLDFLGPLFLGPALLDLGKKETLLGGGVILEKQKWGKEGSEVGKEAAEIQRGVLLSKTSFAKTQLALQGW